MDPLIVAFLVTDALLLIAGGLAGFFWKQRLGWLAAIVASALFVIVGSSFLASIEPAIISLDPELEAINFSPPEQILTWKNGDKLEVTYRLKGLVDTDGLFTNYAWADAGVSGVALSIADDGGPIRITKAENISRSSRNDRGLIVTFRHHTFGKSSETVPRINHAAFASIERLTDDGVEIAVEFVSTVGQIVKSNGTYNIVNQGWGGKKHAYLQIKSVGPGRYVVKNARTRGAGISATPGEWHGFNRLGRFDLFASAWGWEIRTANRRE
jgi:hypothetical protein